MSAQPEQHLPLWLWLGLPLLFLFFIAAVIVFFPDRVEATIESENGAVELGTSLVLLPGIIAGISGFLGRGRLPSEWLGYWLLLVTLGCIYIAGEEISWGQHLLHWDTPEYFQAINDQQETNIHNVSSWFDQKPRLLLELWVLIGGVIMPPWRLFRRIKYPVRDWRYWFWPEIVCFPAALIAILVRIPERFEKLTGVWLLSLHVRLSEVQEFYFAFFLTFYLMLWCSRLTKAHDFT